MENESTINVIERVRDLQKYVEDKLGTADFPEASYFAELRQWESEIDFIIKKHRRSEFKVGSWISIPACCGCWQISAIKNDRIKIDDYNFDLSEEENDFGFDDISGMSLMMFLERLGFVKKSDSTNSKWWEFKKIQLMQDEFGYVVISHSQKPELKYVHQLQNAFPKIKFSIPKR